MTVLTIRSQHRYAVRGAGRLSAGNGRLRDCLMIELSCDGARLSGLGDFAPEVETAATLTLENRRKLDAVVRWARNGCVGLRFAVPLHQDELKALVTACRDEPVAAARVA